MITHCLNSMYDGDSMSNALLAVVFIQFLILAGLHGNSKNNGTARRFDW